MSANKINTKKKDDKSKASKNADPAVEETEDMDFSLLRKPILTSVTGFAQARKIFDMATEELKGLLINECDLLYECRVCRNIFRSLANLISHKRVFCKEKFNSSVHSHFLKDTSVMKEVLKIKKLEESYQNSLTEKLDLTHDEVDESRIPITKDLTSIIEKITKNKGVQQKAVDDQQMVFQKIPKSSVAVFQNVKDDTKSDTMKAQVEELNDILSQDNAELQSDGTFKVQNSGKVLQSDDKDSENTDNVIQISDDDDNEDSDILKCKICDLQFSTLKTLKFHMKYKHLENRLVYPCPDCLDIFSTSWSVYRHLFKVHRKTAAQIRRLRESIQAKAFRMNNPPAFYEKRKTLPKTVPTQKITEEERLYKENQAWLEELDGESEGRRCGGCGRTFERRAALAAHTNTCARRHRRRIQIQIRKDYNKEPNNPYLALAGSAQSPADQGKPTSEDVQMPEKEQKDHKESDEEPPEAEPSTPEDKNLESEEMEIDVIHNKLKFYDNSMINNLPYAQQIEKNNLNAFRQKIASDADLIKLFCKKCETKYQEVEEFIVHMSTHYKWVRYACKLCNFKHFNFDKLPEHVKTVHKLKGNTEFYNSTVKAIDGTEALELSETIDEPIEANETSPNSRRPSRCSSDSSRVSDDSSSSSTRVETGSRKRKSNVYKSIAKKKREIVSGDNDSKDDIVIVEDTVQNKLVIEENSSDMDEIEERNVKRQNFAIIPTVTSRRPVRKKTKPKNADFEYDLSNLLKLEAQGYRDSQLVCTKVSLGKKKTQELQYNYDIINKDCCGALITLSRKSVENAQGHMKTSSCPVFKSSKELRITSVFARPMVPRITKEKSSPKKVDTEESSNKSSPKKVAEATSSLTSINNDLPFNSSQASDLEPDKCEIPTQKNASITTSKDTKPTDSIINDCNKSAIGDRLVESVSNSEKDKIITLENDENIAKPNTETLENTLPFPKPESKLDKTKPSLNMVPIKFRRQSLEVIKNPLIKKNITDFTKAGMKTKILVIKPLNRNSDGTHSLKAPLKFQTIKLKEARRSSANNEEKKSNSVVVVKVPKVDCGLTRRLSTNSIINNGISPASPDSMDKISTEKTEKDVIVSNEPTSKSDEIVLNNNKNLSDTIIDNSSKENKDENVDTNSKPNEVINGPDKTLNSDKNLTNKILKTDNEVELDLDRTDITSNFAIEHDKTCNSNNNLSNETLENNSEQIEQLFSESDKNNRECSQDTEVLMNSGEIVSQDS